jgi:hypothetical protein
MILYLGNNHYNHYHNHNCLCNKYYIRSKALRNIIRSKDDRVRAQYIHENDGIISINNIVIVIIIVIAIIRYNIYC